MERFIEEYKKLNKAQKEAVDSIDGPVMVVAGPGTGKTQILALRIGQILKETDTPPDGILCLTFTNSAVSAMKERLREYIGPTGAKVNVFTFHSFGMKIIEEFYWSLGLESAPILLDDTDTISLVDEILEDNNWQYIKPRSDTSRYFRDLKSLISFLKRERITPEAFLAEIKKDIKNLTEGDENISTRGENKGKLKKEVEKKIESLERTKEVVHFYEFYEKIKKEKNVLDYDDVLEYLVKIVEESDEARATIKERYLYLLVDEHQDSSRVQNEFLQKVWNEAEKPNIFVVGDDRQLIYGFSGASLSYFEEFKHIFGKAKLITLVDNYRSTQIILDASHKLLESTITKEKLVSHKKESHLLKLIECDYPRDEIIACALDIKERIKKGIDINDCAILVPKNKQVRSASVLLHDFGLPVASVGVFRLFDQEETRSFLRVFKIIANPYDRASLAESFFDKLSNIPPILAHKFLSEKNIEKFSLVEYLVEQKKKLFGDTDPIEKWLTQLGIWIELTQKENIYSLIQQISSKFLLENVKEHKELITRVEIIRTILHLVLQKIEKDPKFSLKNFNDFFTRLESYDEDIPLSVFGAEEGVKVLTLHSSKGLEFDYVWIAHMDEKSLVGGKRQGFSLPFEIEKKREKRDEEVLKRQLYVAITRAKRFCNLSYATHSYSGTDQELAQIVAELPKDVFEFQNARETEKKILTHDPKAYVGISSPETKLGKEGSFSFFDLKKLVAQEYENKNVSVSLLNNFFECPWKWYFRNLLRLPEEKSKSLEFGSLVHNAVDKILKSKKTPNEKEILELVEGDKEAGKIISIWVKNRLPEIAKDRENEKSITVHAKEFPHLNIYGKLDLVEKLNNKDLRVIDFKTGNPRKKSDIEKIDDDPAFFKEFGEARGRMSDYMRQLVMYSYLIGESRQGEKVAESVLEYLEAKKENEQFYKTFIDDEKIKMLKQDIRDYDELVKSGKWLERPCNFKSYGRANAECEYCRMAKIYKNC